MGSYFTVPLYTGESSLMPVVTLYSGGEGGAAGTFTWGIAASREGIKGIAGYYTNSAGTHIGINLMDNSTFNAYEKRIINTIYTRNSFAYRDVWEVELGSSNNVSNVSWHIPDPFINTDLRTIGVPYLYNIVKSEYPITYRLINCSAPDAPTEASVGNTVTVTPIFPSNYGVINPSTDAYVMNNGVLIPSTWSNGVLTFTMPDPS